MLAEKGDKKRRRKKSRKKRCRAYRREERKQPKEMSEKSWFASIICFSGEQNRHLRAGHR